MMTTIVRDRALSDEQAWAAVLGRDRRLDGRLFYGVASTGVYCRPSCPSRRPRRHNAALLRRRRRRRSARATGPACAAIRAGERVETPPAPVGKAREYLDRHFDEPVNAGGARPRGRA